MQVRPITDDELPDFIAVTREEYVRQKHVMGSVPLQEAREQAARETAQLFPEGNLSAGHAVLLAVDDAGERIGRLWLAPRGDSTDVAFVYEVEVEATQRGKGYGRALMHAAQDWARANGYRAIALHVFGGNDVAIKLYESLGYRTTDLLMKLEL